MIELVQSLLAAVHSEPASWPRVGVFHTLKSRRMPGFPGHVRLGFKLSAHLFRALNEGRPPAAPEPEGSTSWIEDMDAVDRATRVLTEELQRAGRVAIPGLGTFEVERRELGNVEQFFAVFHTEPALLRRLNPKEEAYALALKAEWPDGPPVTGIIEA